MLCKNLETKGLILFECKIDEVYKWLSFGIFKVYGILVRLVLEC